MTGTALADFNDFVEGTGPTYVTGPQTIINEAVKNTYWFGRLIQGARAKKKMLQGGSNIRESVVFQDNGTFEMHLPGANHIWQNPQRLERVQVEYRYALAHMSWVEQEILLNESITRGTADAKFHEYVRIRDEKEMLMWTAKWNGVENQLWQVPDAATMEGTGIAATQTYAIPAFINEETNGLFNSDVASTSVTAFTTVEGLDPTAAEVNSRWAPQQETYDSAASGDDNNIVATFDDMYQAVEFEQPPSMKEYWEDPRYNKQMIVTDSRGRAIYMNLLRQGQDHFIAGTQDPSYSDPQFHGIPIRRASTLDTAALYDDGANGFATAGATTVDEGPRYYWINAEYLYPVFHEQRYFHKYEVTKHHNVHDTWVCPVGTWYNLICTSRQRQGIVSPTAVVYTY